MIIQIVKLKSALAEEELLTKAKERAPQFAEIPGLLQKYYVKLGEEGHYGGVYVWDSRESLQTFQASELAVGIPKAYQVIDAPDVELMDVIFQLRNA